MQIVALLAVTVIMQARISPAVPPFTPDIQTALDRIMPPGTPTLLRIAGITALVVPTMSYVVSPQLTRLFKKWLYPGPS